MRRLAVALALSPILIAACAKQDAAPVADAPATPAINLADLAGTWSATTTPQGSDSVIVAYTITGSADAAGWTIALPGRDVMPLSVTVSGDSLLTQTPSFESVLRPGVQVFTTGVLRLVDGQLTGPMVAHYPSATGPDSVANLWTTATRAP